MRDEKESWEFERYSPPSCHQTGLAREQVPVGCTQALQKKQYKLQCCQQSLWLVPNRYRTIGKARQASCANDICGVWSRRSHTISFNNSPRIPTQKKKTQMFSTFILKSQMHQTSLAHQEFNLTTHTKTLFDQFPQLKQFTKCVQSWTVQGQTKRNSGSKVSTMQCLCAHNADASPRQNFQHGSKRRTFSSESSSPSTKSPENHTIALLHTNKEDTHDTQKNIQAHVTQWQQNARRWRRKVPDFFAGCLPLPRFQLQRSEERV